MAQLLMLVHQSEQYGDSTQLLYLRARHYSPADGRFTSRDTWSGDVNRPLSLNRWMYVEGNPINLTDSSGNFPTLPSEDCSTPAKRVATAKKYMPIGDELNTYAAAGIAVQCFGIYQDIFTNEDANDGQGIGQISENQASNAWGVVIKKPNFGGHGLLCYIVRRAIGDTLCVCDTEDNIKEMYPGSKYQLEQPRPLSDSAWSAELMRRRIKIVLDKCNNNLKCTGTDRFIIAAFAQNGSGFTIFNMDNIKNHFFNNGEIDWNTFLSEQDERPALVGNLKKFRKYAFMLRDDGYLIPEDYNDSDVLDIIYPIRTIFNQ
jgi:RHS repeat-associated protein